MNDKLGNIFIDRRTNMRIKEIESNAKYRKDELDNFLRIFVVLQIF